MINNLVIAQCDLWGYPPRRPRTSKENKMGRPLNKKYFGNTNYDSGIGGESIDSIAIDTVGTYTALATVSLNNAPTLPGGVAATLGSVHMYAKSATALVAGTNYLVNDLITLAGATVGTKAVFQVTSINGGGGVTGVSVYTAGNMTTLGANPIATTTNSVAGAGATLTVSYGVLGVDVTSGGSGYENATDAAITFSGGGSAATGHSVMTAAQLNAITPIAKVIGSSTNLAADIVKQTGTNHYLMTTSDGTSVCTLVATTSLNPGDAYLIATDSTTSTYYITKLTAHRATLILQTDNSGGGGVEYPDGWEAPWTLDAATVGVVSITNY